MSSFLKPKFASEVGRPVEKSTKNGVIEMHASQRPVAAESSHLQAKDANSPLLHLTTAAPSSNEPVETLGDRIKVIALTAVVAIAGTVTLTAILHALSR